MNFLEYGECYNLRENQRVPVCECLSNLFLSSFDEIFSGSTAAECKSILIDYKRGLKQPISGLFQVRSLEYIVRAVIETILHSDLL